MADDEEKKIIPYKNAPSQTLGANKELQKIEDRFNLIRAKKSFDVLDDKLKSKNTYFGKSKIPDVYEKDLKEDLETTMKNINTGKNLQINYNYCQKCPVYKNNCKHMNERVQVKDKYSYPITSYSTLGWMEPIEGKFQQSFKQNAETKQFFDSSHLSINNR